MAFAASTLSSTTSTRSGRPGPVVVDGAWEEGAGASAGGASGSLTTNSLPRPGPSLDARSHRSAVHLDQGPDHGQADPQAALRAVEGSSLLHEQVEGPSEELLAHAHPVVGHPDHRLVAFGHHRERDVPADVRVLGRVVDQVGEHLHEARGIGVERQRPGRQRHRELLPLLDDHRATDLHRLQEQGAQLYRLLAELDLALADARHVQQIVEQALHVLHLPRNDGAVAGSLLFLARRGAIEDLDGAEDGRQRIAQLVRQHRQKLVLAAIGLAQLLLRVLALLLGLLALGDVLAGAEHAGSPAGGVALEPGPRVDGPHGPVRPHDPVLLLEGQAAREAAAGGLAHRVAIRGVDGAEEDLVSDLDAARLVPEDPVGLVRPP